MAYETTFADGTVITRYLASAYAEGFCEGDGASTEDQLRVWSYLCGTKLGYQLQGFYGRQITNMIEQGYMDADGTINWEECKGD
jgi:hypothetical protein